MAKNIKKSLTAETEVTPNDVTTYDENSGNATINPGLRADLMRKQMESKNTLRHYGSLYIGAASSNEDGYDPETGVYPSKELSPLEDTGLKTKSGSLTVVGADNALGYDVDYYQPFSYDKDSGILTITWFEPEQK